jgi:hypothetical protein
MEVYLSAGGDPNGTVPSGMSLLFTAMMLIAISYIEDSDVEDSDVEDSDVEDCDVEDCDVENCDVEDSHAEHSHSEHINHCGTRNHSVDLLVMLISAGADIYGIINLRDCHGCANTLTDVAFALDIGKIWADALDRCGFHICEVFYHSDECLVQHRKLCGASRTGVDVQDIVAQPEATGLRHRNTSRVKEML